MNAGSDLRERVDALANAPTTGRFGLIGRVAGAVVRAALPPVCAGCGVGGYWICPICDQRAQRLDLASVCQRCGRGQCVGSSCDRCAGWSDSLALCRSAYLFDDVVRETIHRLKYQGEYARSEWCGVEIARLVIELGWMPDLLVPVPLHRTRLRSRGYNQSARIAAIAATQLAQPWGNVLVRMRATASQVGLDADDRRDNVAGAFESPHDLSDLSILLVDDVVTTGATLEACADACRIAGARTIAAVTLATAS
jgi:ComF family protein